LLSITLKFYLRYKNSLLLYTLSIGWSKQ
jgi:hypothetical protein